MAVILNAKGTSESAFSIGKQGPRIKNNAGVIELRNAEDTAFANFQSLGIDDNATETVITIDVDETVQLYRNQADANELLTLIQDDAGASGDVIAIGNDGTGDGIQIVNTGNARGIYIDTSAPSANAIEVLNQFVVSSITSPANYITVTAATTTNAPSVSASGSDTNVDLDLVPQGTGGVNISGKANLPQYAVSALPTGAVGDMVYCTDGNAGSPCMAVHDGSNWKVVAFGATVSAT